MAVQIYTKTGVDAALARLQQAIDAVSSQGYDDTELRQALQSLQNTVADHNGRLTTLEGTTAYDDAAITGRVASLERNTQMVVAEDGLTATIGE